MLKDILSERDISVYSLSKESGIPYSTLSDLINGKTDIKDCSAKNLYSMSKCLHISMENLFLCNDKADKLYIYNEGRCVFVDHREVHIAYEGPKNLISFKEVIALSVNKVLTVDTYYREDDGSIYVEEEYIDLKDLFDEYNYDISGVAINDIKLGKPNSGDKTELIDKALLVSDNMAILPSNSIEQPETVVVINLSRPGNKAQIRLEGYGVLLSNMKEKMQQRAVEAVKRNITIIRPALEERRNRA